MPEKQNLPAEVNAAPPPAPSLTFLPDQEDGQGADAGLAMLKRYAGAVWRRKWMVLLIVAAGTTAGVLAGPYVPQKYVAEVTLLFQPPDENAQMRGPIQASEMLQDESWISLLRSYTVLDYVAREQRLFLDYRARDRDVIASFDTDSAFALGEFELRVDDAGRLVSLRTNTGIPLETVPVGEALGTGMGYRWTPPREALRPKREVPFTVLTLREGAKQLDERLGTRLARGGNFLSLNFSDEDPARVATVVNAVAERYVAIAAELKRARVTQLRDILETQLEQAELKLRNAQIALESYRVQTITQPSETSSPISAGLEITLNPVLSNFFQLQIEKEQIQRDRDAIERALAAGTDSVSVDALSVVTAVQQSPELSQSLLELAGKRAELRTLGETYTPEHPLAKRALASVDTLQGRVVPRLARRLISELDDRISVLGDLLSSSSVELREIPARAMDEARLRRDVAIAETLANDLRQRFESARLGSESTVPDVRILDRATQPQRPASDMRIQLALMAFAGSLGLSVLLSVLLDRIDPRLRYADQVTRDLRLPIIGAVPTLSTRRRIGRGHGAEVVEALRGIRLNLMHAYGKAGPMMFTITSPGSGDGKTFITSNLAIAFSDLGLRVLAIDGDTRRGQLHHLLQLERMPGLTDYLSGDAMLPDVIRSTSYPNVHLLPGGRRLANAPELLSSPRMGEMLAAIKPEYDVILIDSPPLGAGVDPLVLGTLSGNMMLVMRTGITDRSMAEAKLQMLDRLPIRILGTVLNGFDGGESYRYYSYLPGYEAVSEAAGALEPA
ncbi:MAG TPA: polysaccharide biosynthesis tyrosine autokinase [Gemmatimonadaceae bacterium]|nr:polysaccharide biosynthesis tyrosine autokinase [Gemmatimonadaceae bacterium]